jgi:hypothetical protein
MGTGKGKDLYRRRFLLYPFPLFHFVSSSPFPFASVGLARFKKDLAELRFPTPL